MGGLGEWAADHDGIVTLAQYAAARLADGSCCPAARRCRLLRTNCTPSTLPSRESFSMQPTLVGLPGKPGLDQHPGSKIAHHTGWPSWAARSTQLPLCWRRDLQRVLICRLREVRAMQGVGASSLMRRSRARHCETCASGLAGTSPFMVNSTMAPGVDGLAMDGTKPIEEANDWRRGNCQRCHATRILAASSYLFGPRGGGWAGLTCAKARARIISRARLSPDGMGATSGNAVFAREADHGRLRSPGSLTASGSIRQSGRPGS